MSNKPSSIIINKAKIGRIDPENVELEVSASVLDKDNDSITKSEVQLIINRENIGNILSDSDGFIDVKKILGLQEGDSLSIQFIEAIHGVKSKVKIITAEEKKEDVEVKKITPVKKDKNEKIDNREIAKKLILERLDNLCHRVECKMYNNDLEIISFAIKQNPIAFQYAGSIIKKDKDFILGHIVDFPEIVEYMDNSLMTKELVLLLIDTNPNIISTSKISSYIDTHKILVGLYNNATYINGDVNFIGLKNIDELFKKLVMKMGPEFIENLKGIAQLYRVNSIIDDKKLSENYKIIELLNLLRNFFNISNNGTYINYLCLEYCDNTLIKCFNFLSEKCIFTIAGISELSINIEKDTGNGKIGFYYQIYYNNFAIFNYIPKTIIKATIKMLYEKISLRHRNSTYPYTEFNSYDEDQRNRMQYYINILKEYVK